jgi:hypothetical protein
VLCDGQGAALDYREPRGPATLIHGAAEKNVPGNQAAGMVSQKLVGIRRARVSHLKHLWLDAAYEGGGKRWAEEVLGLSVQIVRKPAKPIPEKVEDLG